MKIIVLAAGYATRLYPLTLTQPKPLLPVAGRPMLEHLLNHLGFMDGIDRVYLVTNAKFLAHFQEWWVRYDATKTRLNLTLVNDGSTHETNQLGAIGDLHYVLKTQQVDDDVVVVAGDNLFSRPLADFGRFCCQRDAPVLAVYDVGNVEEIRRYSSISLDDQGRILFFEEKPAKPSSTLAGIALYYFPRRLLPWIDQYIALGNNPDQPGRLIQWLYPRMPVYTWKVPGRWYDIGSVETLAMADQDFSQA